jgi:hypothetical protein
MKVFGLLMIALVTVYIPACQRDDKVADLTLDSRWPLRITTVTV